MKRFYGVRGILLLVFSLLCCFACNPQENGVDPNTAAGGAVSQSDDNGSTDDSVPSVTPSGGGQATAVSGALAFEAIGGYAGYDGTSGHYSYAEVADFVADDVLTVDLSAMKVKAGDGEEQSIPAKASALSLFDGKLAAYYTGTAGENDGQLWFYGDGKAVSDEPDAPKYTYNNRKLSIVLKGTAEKGLCVKVKKDASVRIVLDGATISSGNYPCIMNDGKAPVYLEIKDGTVNNVADGRSFGTGYSKANGVEFYDSSLGASDLAAARQAAEDEGEDLEETRTWALGDSSKGTVFTKGDMYVTGTGTLNVTEGYKHGIVSSKGFIRICDNAVISITSTGRNGFHAANGFIMDNGTITVSGTGDRTDNESRGIVVEGYDEDATGDKAGFIVIKGGSLNITTVSKAITAKWVASEDQTETGAAEGYSPDPHVLITGGTITIRTTGTPYESTRAADVLNADGVTEAVTDLSLSPEGIEGKSGLYIYGGRIECNTTDDCLNVSLNTGTIDIHDGYVYAYSSKNDCIDSNGTIKISGGVVVALTTVTPECAFDCDNNDFIITGGTLIGIGTGNYSRPTAAKCGQGVVIMSGASIGDRNKALVVKDSSGNVRFAYNVPLNSGSNLVVIFSSPGLTADETYSVVSGATVSGGSVFRGIYTVMPESCSGGSSAINGISFASGYVHTQSGAGTSGPADGQRPTGPGTGKPR